VCQLCKYASDGVPSWHRRQIGAIYTADVAVQAALLASIPILAAMLPGDALNCVYSGAPDGHSVAYKVVSSSARPPITCR